MKNLQPSAFSLRSLKILVALFFFCTSLAVQAEPSKKLIFAIDVIRHGDRTPIIEIPKAHHRWSEGLGQLTALGMHQEYELGKKFHHRYVVQEKLLPRNYQPGTLYVRSTDVDRTLMSAECVLMGLYPPGTGPFLHPSFLMNWFALPYGFQPIPIHTVPQDQDFLLLVRHHREEIKQTIEAIPECREKEEALRPHFAAWSQVTGLPIRDAIDLEMLGDALYIGKLKHLPLPKGLSNADATTILEAQKSIFKKSITSADRSGKNLLLEIKHHLKETSLKKSSLKYILYSAHDSTIMSLLAAMGASIEETPHYSSDLNIALYEMQDHHFAVQVTLNDHPVLLPGMKSTTCSLPEFLELAPAQ